jgi:hypothetical protein
MYSFRSLLSIGSETTLERRGSFCLGHKLKSSSSKAPQRLKFVHELGSSLCLSSSTTDFMPSRLDLRRAGFAPSSAPLSLITDGPMLPGGDAVSALDVGPSGTEQFDVGFDREWQGEELVPPTHENDVNLSGDDGSCY